jgi:signal transduction histidine kinase
VVNDIETAVEHFLKGLEVLKKGKARKIANKQSIEEEIFDEVVLFNYIANMYNRMERQDKPMEYLVQAKTVMDNNAPTKYRISISDTGVGMSAEQIEHLFHIDNIYSQAGTANEKGSGFGLLVCKELLEKHGSKLHVESVVGEGSRFWFEI